MNAADIALFGAPIFAGGIIAGVQIGAHRLRRRLRAAAAAVPGDQLALATLERAAAGTYRSGRTAP